MRIGDDDVPLKPLLCVTYLTAPVYVWAMQCDGVPVRPLCLCRRNDRSALSFRTALKLRRLQRALLLHRLPLEEAVLAFQSEAWRLPCSGVAAVPDVLAVLTELYGRLQPPLSCGTALALRVDLCLNWLISVYDRLVYRATGTVIGQYNEGY